MKKITIAIDGFSSTGKSTLAKQLASHLGYVYVDTGAMYRAVTLFAMQHGYISNEFFDRETLIRSLPSITLEFRYSPEAGFGEMYLNDERVEDLIRSLDVSSMVSRVAEVSEVRHKLVEQQKRMGRSKGIVMDGRDIGTVVFPDAELKIYMTAAADVRARRRFEELTFKGQIVSYDDVLKNVQERDFIDTHRDDSPLCRAQDAVEIDNSHLTREQQFAIVAGLADEAIRVAQLN